MIVSIGRILRLIWPMVIVASVVSAGAQAAAPLNADAIIHQAIVRASSRNSPANSPGYTYTKVNVTEEFDNKGKVKERKERTFQVYFRAGTSYVKLLEVDGHAPAHADVKFQAETQSNVHQFFGQPASGPDKRDTFMTPELAARFDFALRGQCSFNGRPTYEISFQPKSPEPPVHKIMDRFLNHISGTLWIDAEEFEIARADLQLGSEVDVLGGVIGCLRKLVYSMTRVRVADGIWLHSFSSGDFEGRKLLEPMRIRTKSECSNFRLMASS